MLDKLETLSGRNAAIYNVKPESREGSPSSFYGRSSRKKGNRSRDNSIGRGSMSRDTNRNVFSKESERCKTSPKKSDVKSLLKEISIEEREVDEEL